MTKSSSNQKPTRRASDVNAPVELIDPIWEQQPKEPHLWFVRFSIFLAMGCTRTFVGAFNQELAEKGLEGRRKKVPGSWQNAIEKWRWVERAHAWDLDQVGQKSVKRQERIDTDTVFQELAAIATSNMVEYLDFYQVERHHPPDATTYERALIEAQVPEIFFSIKKLDELPLDKQKAIAEISIEDTKFGQRHRIKLHSKPQALNTLATALGILSDSNIAFETFKRYGYVVRPTPYGYKLMDSYTEAGRREVELEQQAEVGSEDSSV